MVGAVDGTVDVVVAGTVVTGGAVVLVVVLAMVVVVSTESDRSPPAGADRPDPPLNVLHPMPALGRAMPVS